MKKLLSTTAGKVLIALYVFVVVLLVALSIKEPPTQFAREILCALLVTTALMVGIDLGYKAWQRKRQEGFDARMAAREGIEDRRREWAEWTAELKRQRIDRYQLPMYLLVGEPQSGKSIMLHNSDLHFPFGQNRLSGVGGTKGCDWWFTDQAVILDLAGRLFTHEGGASDEAEWAAFLELLADYRPQCPANGVILVLPCDALASDAEPALAKKAAKMQAALRTLTDQLEARLPVYVVLTKADKVFGFAECVHRLEAEERQEMFGWSRPLEKLEAPFDVAEAQAGFAAVVERARLLRSRMLATARMPEAQTEVDRLYAFPDELAALWPSLSLYLQRIFSESRLIDMLFFRGFYLTSGLQSGAPIAKVCAELMGSMGEADRRSLDSLFVRQRAYFIKDLVRERIFTEQGLVRPTRKRVVRTRRNAMIAYTIVAVSALGSVGWATWSIVEANRKKPDEARMVDAVDQARQKNNLEAGLEALERVQQSPVDLMGDYGNHVVSQWLLPCLCKKAVEGLSRTPPRGFEEFEAQANLAAALLQEKVIDDLWPAIRRLIEEQDGPKNLAVLDQQRGKRMTLDPADRTAVEQRLKELWNGVIDPGSGWAQPGPFGFWWGAESLGREPPGDACEVAERRLHTIHLLFESAKLPSKEERGSIESGKAMGQLDALAKLRSDPSKGGDGGTWSNLDELRERIRKEKELRIDPKVLAFLENDALREISQPGFLTLPRQTLRAQDLAKLSEDLRKRPRGADEYAMSVFRDRARCAGDQYASAFPKLDELLTGLSVEALGFDRRVSEHLGNLLGALDDEALSEWRNHVLYLLDLYEDGMLKTWSVKPGTIETELKPHFDLVSPSIKSPGREAWLAKVVDCLVANMGSNVQVAAEQFLKHTEFSGLDGKKYASTLRDMVKGVKRSLDKPPKLAERLTKALEAAGAPQDTGAERFVEKYFEAFCEFLLHHEIRPGFEEELRVMAGNQGIYRDTLRAIWGEPFTPKLELFDRGGALDKLFEGYWIVVAGLPDDSPAARGRWTFERFAGPSLGRDPLYDTVQFLREFQVFLLASTSDPEKKSAKAAELAVTIVLDQISQFPQNKGYLYVKSGRSDFKSSTQKGRKNIEIKCTLVQDTGLRFVWSDHTPTPEKDTRALEKPVPGMLAPVVLAWSGLKTSDGWEVNGAPDDKGYFKLILRFTPPLPARPAGMPFPAE